MLGLDIRHMSGIRVPTTTGERVKMRRHELQLSQTELGTRAGLTQPTISSLEKNRSHTSGSLASIARALNVSALWLETGLGEMLPQRGDELPAESADSDAFMVPLLDCKGSCGNGRLYGDVDYSPITISARLLGPHRHTPPDKLIGLYAEGDSMAPFIMPGDIMLFDTGGTDFHDGGIYLIDTPDGLRVKRVNRRADGRVILRSDSADKARYPDEEYTAEQAPSLIVKGRFILRIG